MLAHGKDADTLDTEKGSVPKIPKEVQTCKMLVMTNHETHNEIVSFYKDNDYFGGDPDQFVFFPQTMLPAFTTEGKIMLAGKGKIKLAPNGNGAFFDSVAKTASL